MKHEIRFVPAYDRRSEGYGIHPVEIAFIVKDDHGALVWTLNTNWYLNSGPPREPWGGMLANHLYVTDPHVDFDTVKEDCGWLDGEPCMCTYSTGLRGEELLTTLKRGGETAVFAALEIIHKEHRS